MNYPGSKQKYIKLFRNIQQHINVNWDSYSVMCFVYLCLYVQISSDFKSDKKTFMLNTE